MSRRRVLMIAHHFPPAGGSGSNRALAFSRYLPEHDWTPTVLTPGAAWAANRDAALLAEVPEGLRVVRTRSFETRAAVVEGSAHRSSVPYEAFETGDGHLVVCVLVDHFWPKLCGALEVTSC